MDEEEKKGEKKKRKSRREFGLRGGKGRKLANWLAVVIQFKMDDGRGGLGVQTRGCLVRVYTSSQMAPPRLVSARIILLSIGSRHPGANRRSDARGGRGQKREKKLASLHRESALIKAPFYTFRWHQGITSVSRYFFFPSPILFPFSPLFSSLLLASRFLFRFFSLFFFLSFISFFFPFFLFFPWDQRHAGYEIKGKRERGEEEEEERPVEFRNDAVCVGLFRTNSALCTYRWVISSVERNLIITQ